MEKNEIPLRSVGNSHPLEAELSLDGIGQVLLSSLQWKDHLSPFVS